MALEATLVWGTICALAGTAIANRDSRMPVPGSR
jgi:hypothetical protein